MALLFNGTQRDRFETGRLRENASYIVVVSQRTVAFRQLEPLVNLFVQLLIEIGIGLEFLLQRSMVREIVGLFETNEVLDGQNTDRLEMAGNGRCADVLRRDLQLFRFRENDVEQGGDERWVVDLRLRQHHIEPILNRSDEIRVVVGG